MTVIVRCRIMVVAAVVVLHVVAAVVVTYARSSSCSRNGELFPMPEPVSTLLWRLCDDTVQVCWTFGRNLWVVSGYRESQH
jgi:hypothetical protein